MQGKTQIFAWVIPILHPHCVATNLLRLLCPFSLLWGELNARPPCGSPSPALCYFPHILPVSAAPRALP